MDLTDALTKSNATVIVVMPNLDNAISGCTDVLSSQKESDIMSKRLKERVQVGSDQNGAPIYKWASGQNSRELQADIARILIAAGVLEGMTQAKSEPSITVKEFIEQTYLPTFTTFLAPTTRENYRQYIELNIVPFMGDMPMNEVTVATIQQFYDWMATAASRGRKKDLNAKTIERVSGLAGRIFKVAQEMNLISESPFKRTLLTIRGEAAGHHEALPDELVIRAKRLIPMLENRDERLYSAMLMYTGMRTEEVRGMMWEDLNLDEQYGTISRAVTYPDNSKPHIGKPKTKTSSRTVLVPKPLVDILAPEQKPSGFIFGDDKPWCYSKARRVSKRAFTKLGIDEYTSYDCRTTFGTQMKEGGLTSAQVADLMGHADTRMVETVYARTRHEGVMKRLADVERVVVCGGFCGKGEGLQTQLT